jgi:hypothetical protein
MSNQKTPRKNSWKTLGEAFAKLYAESQEQAYYTSKRHHFSANVKLYSTGSALEDAWAQFLKHNPNYENQWPAIEEHFHSHRLDEIFNQWIERECDWLLTQWLTGSNHLPPTEWEMIIEKIKTGQQTGYSEIEELPTQKAKLKWATKQKTDDAMWLEALALVDKESAGFFGRSGGHFCFDSHVDFDQAYNLSEEINLFVTEIREGKAKLTDRAAYLPYDFRTTYKIYTTLKKQLGLLQMICRQVTKMAKNMSFKNELLEQIEYFIDTTILPEEYTKITKRYGHVELKIKDSLAAGNCLNGTRNWLAKNFPGRKSITINEALSQRNNPALNRVIRKKIHDLQRDTQPGHPHQNE